MPAAQIRAIQTGRFALSATATLAAGALVFLDGAALLHGTGGRPLLTSAAFVRLAAAAAMLACFLWAWRETSGGARHAAAVLLGPLIVVSSGAHVFLGARSSVPLFAAGAASLLTLGSLYGLRAALFAQLCCAAVHAAGLLLRDQAALSSYAVLSVTLVAATAFVKLAGGEWEAQSRLFEQAKWAAVEIARANARLQDERNRTEVRTLTSERERLAREIHDTVGHTLTAMLVQMDALRVDIAQDHRKALSRLETLESTVREAMHDVRREVSMLRDDAGRRESWKTRWLKLCTTFADSTGIRVNTSIADELLRMPDELGETLYRVFQESLTNAYRHGRATLVDIAAGIRDDRLVIRISDNGAGAAAVSPGNGLRGMQERVHALGGDVAWATQPGKGFDIGIVFHGAEERLR